MNAIFRNSRYILAILFLGAALTACNKSDTGADANKANGGAATPMSPAAPDNTAPPPAPAPAPAPTPDTSSAMPPATTPPASDSGSTASAMANNAGTAVDDTMITGKVKAALLADSEVKGLDIHVDTKDGDVTLSGTVDSQAQIDNAQRIAKTIDGVKNVNSTLTVKAG